MLLQMVLFHSFLWLRNIPLYVCTSLFLHSSADGHLGCFHVLAVVNRAPVAIGVHVSFQIRVFVFSGFSVFSGSQERDCCS